MVVAIIGLLASIVLVSVNTARKKARDARRLSELRQIQTALEMYYNDNGTYPTRHLNSGSANWISSLGADLAPYLSSMPLDPVNSSPYLYRYDGGEADDYPGYGLFCAMEHSGNFSLADSDGGWYNLGDGRYYEIGPEPAYDKSSGNNWWSD